MRIVGIDFGEKHIGVAAADDRMNIALPVGTTDVNGDPVDAVVRIVEEQRADQLVVGLPLSLTGAEGPQAQRVRSAIEQLSHRVAIPIKTYDERLTTAQARHASPGARAGRRAQREGAHRNATAAAIMLQAYLDSLKPYG